MKIYRKTKISKKIVNNINVDGLSTDNLYSYTYVWGDGAGVYTFEHLTVRDGRKVTKYYSMNVLEDAMRKVQPDLRKWRIGA